MGPHPPMDGEERLLSPCRHRYDFDPLDEPQFAEAELFEVEFDCLDFCGIANVGFYVEFAQLAPAVCRKAVAQPHVAGAAVAVVVKTHEKLAVRSSAA